MSHTPTPSELIEIRRVKAMVAGAGNTINPQCFLGSQGPVGPVGPRGPAMTISTITGNNSILYYDSAVGVTGSDLFTFSSTINPLGLVTIQGDLQVAHSIYSSTIIASTIITNSIFVSSISTYSMCIYGENTLTVQGNTYASNVNLLNDVYTGYLPVVLANGSLSVNNTPLAPSFAVLNSMFTMNLHEGYFSPVSHTSDYYYSFESDQNTIALLPNIASNINIPGYTFTSDEAFQCVSVSCSLDLSLSGTQYCRFGLSMSSNYDPLFQYYQSNTSAVYYTVSNVGPNYVLKGYGPQTNTDSNIQNIALLFTKPYVSSDSLTITAETILDSNAGSGIINSGYVRYCMLINGVTFASNHMMNLPLSSNYNSNTHAYQYGIVPYDQIPYFMMTFSNLNPGDIYRNIKFSGANVYISPATAMASASVIPYVSSPTYYGVTLPDLAYPVNTLSLSNYQSTLYFNGQGVAGPNNIIQSYLTSSMNNFTNNSVYTLVWPNTIQGTISFNPATNTLRALNDNPSPAYVCSLESYQNAFFSCDPTMGGGNNTEFGMVDTTDRFRYYFSYNAANLNLETNFVYNDGTHTSNAIKVWNPNDILAISVTTQDITVISSDPRYTASVVFSVNGSNTYPASETYSSGNTPSYLKAGFGILVLGDIYKSIIFSGSYGYTKSSNAYVALASYPYDFSPLYSNMRLIDTIGGININSLSNTNAGLYFNGFPITGSNTPYISTATLNNGIFSLVIPNSVATGTLLFNSAQNSLYAASNYTTGGNQIAIVTSVESYKNIFFSCKANISDDTGATKFGIIDPSSPSSPYNYYFYKSGGYLYAFNNIRIKTWNSNDILAISLTNSSANLKTANFYVNGGLVNTVTNTTTTTLYKIGFNYFNAGDSYTNIVFSGSYRDLTSTNTSVFLTTYPFTQSPTYSTIQLIDTVNQSNIIPLSNYQSTLYFNGMQVGGSAPLTSSIIGLGSSSYVSSLGLVSTVNGLGSSGYISTNPTTVFSSYASENITFGNTDTDVGVSLLLKRKNITMFNGTVAFNVSTIEAINNNITLSMYSNNNLVSPVAYTTIVAGTYNSNYFSLPYNYTDTTSLTTNSITWSLKINNFNGSAGYSTFSTVVNMTAVVL